MVKSLMLTRQLLTCTDCSMIYFANDELALDMIKFLQNRFHFINEYNNEKAKEAGMRNWMVYYGTNKTPCMITLAPIACRDYKNQPIIYKIAIRESFKPESIKITDMFTDRTVAERITNLFNANSDGHTASVEEIMVINSEESLEGLKKFLVSDKDIGEQWEYFSKIKP